jgi:NAD(P)-dependent dehydrogenase (short-subunit alcohol dehydrogenase family)
VAPGYIKGDVEQSPDTTAPVVSRQPLPMRRAGRPGEVAAFIEFLLGPNAGFFCGSTLFLDGGAEAELRPDDWPQPWTPGDEAG